MTPTELLEIELPIVQAPMAGIQDSALAIAVANAGGLGSLPCAMLSIEQLESELNTLKTAVDKAINLNFFCHQTPEPEPRAEARWRELLQPYFLELGVNPESIPVGTSRQPFNHDIADVLQAHAPRIISFHFGLPPEDLLKRVKSWGSTILSSATTVEEALWLEENGADLIVAQGVEAGGHRGMFLSKDLASQSNTATLVSNIINRVNLPVIAAGGISTAGDVLRSINDGTDAVQIGTAYLLCNEARTSPLHRKALQQTNPPVTSLTNIFSGRPARGIVNRAIEELGPICRNAPEFPLAAAAITVLRNAAESKESSDFTPLWCGQNTQGCEQISAYELSLKLASKL